MVYRAHSSRRRPQLWLQLMLLLPVLLTAAGSAPAVDEVAIMRRLRQALHDLGAAAMADGPGWQLGNPSHPCTWDGVACTHASPGQEQHVTGINLACSRPSPLPNGSRPSSSGSGGGETASGSGPLLPELAQLQWVEHFLWDCKRDRLPGSIPPEWGAPAAWPRLKTLSITVAYLQGDLPDIQPGALPQLEEVFVGAEVMQATLPASWGASPHVLPALRELSLRYSAPALPSQWAAGFRKLEELTIGRWPDSYLQTRDSVRAKAGALAPVHLPPEWASLPGSFPKLRYLEVVDLNAAGPLPPVWTAGGFPSLETLDLSFNNLTGTLPTHVFQAHPRLARLRLGTNSFHGQLPDPWGLSLVAREVALEGNALTGPAFPPTWLEPGRLPGLEVLRLAGNPGLAGTLPDTLWGKLGILTLERTAVSGSIPSSWCQLPLGDDLPSLKIAHTNIDPVLPPCAAIVRPLLIHTHDSPQEAHVTPHVPMSGLAAVLMLGAAAASAAVRCKLRQRQQQQQQQQQRQQQGGHVSLTTRGLQQQQGSASAAGDPAEVGGAARLGMRARVGVLIRAHLDSHGRGIEFTPLAEQQSALAHQLGSRDLPEGWEWDSSTDGDAGSRSRLLSDNSGTLSSEVPPSSWEAAAAGVAAPRSRQWGLPTQSLRMSVSELQFVTDEQDTLVVLGVGAHAVCYLAKIQGGLAAVKVCELEPGVDSRVAWREVALLHACVHSRIVPLLGVALKGSLLMVAMPFMQGGSLASALAQEDTRRALRWEASGRRVAADVAEALAYLHGRSVMHGDLKPANILLSREHDAYIADLGVAQVMGVGGPAPGFTRGYAAPEQLLGTPCTLAADIYSLGLLLIVLTTQRPLHKRGGWTLPRAPGECPQGVVCLIERCLQPSPEQRPSAAEVLRQLREEGGADRDGGGSASGSSASAPHPLPII